ncbi:MAG: 4'-phosphopantetheinyl transferase superfamily protein [bacterium]|nr:4'-phosphopantetheinyl transferase superfamily protein [bacterium]
MIKHSIEIKKLEDIKTISKKIDNIFTEEEQKSNKITLTGKFAAKDAFLKNIGIVPSERFYKKIEIGKMSSGRPFIKILDTNLSNKIAGYKISLSISHTKEEAVAICILYKTNNGKKEARYT